MQKRRIVLSVTILSTALKSRNGCYLLTGIKEIGIVRGMKYFDLWLMEYDLEKKQIHPKAKEIEITLPENLIEKAENISVVQEGMLGFNNGGILKIFNKPRP